MKRVLIVEDNTVIREFLVKLINQLDPLIDVKDVATYKGAKKIYEETYIDAFFLDIHLGDGSGYDLAKEIRLLDHYKFKPVVFLTGDVDYQLEAHLDVRCYKYLLKPFHIDELREVLFDVVSFGIEEDETRQLTLKSRGESYRVNESEIVYMEYRNRHLHIRTIDDELVFSSYTLKEITDMVTENFVQCHKSFIINPKYIHRISESDGYIVLRSNTERIPIGRKYRKEIHELCSM